MQVSFLAATHHSRLTSCLSVNRIFLLWLSFNIFTYTLVRRQDTLGFFTTTSEKYECTHKHKASIINQHTSIHKIHTRKPCFENWIRIQKSYVFKHYRNKIVALLTQGQHYMSCICKRYDYVHSPKDQ